MDFMKVFDQTVREIKREVNLKVLKVPEIEQKVLDATDDEPWGPHGTALAEIAQATKKFSESQMVMNVLWTRLTETGKNWRFVYKSLAVIEYLVAHGSERAVDDIIEHTYQISSLTSFEYVEPSGKDLGINVRKKAENIVALLNNKEKIQEVRNKAAANRDKYVGVSSSGVSYKSNSASFSSSSGSFRSNERYGGFGSKSDGDSFKDSYSEKDRYDEEKIDQSTYKSKKGSSRYGSKVQDTVSASGSKTMKKIGEPKKSSSQSSTVPSSNYEEDFDDFDPRGTSSAKPSTGNSNQVDLFGQNLIGDLLDAPTPAPAATSTVNTDPSEVDLFADATFVSAKPQIPGVASQTPKGADLFASQPAPSATASTIDFFAAPDPVVQSNNGFSKPQIMGVTSQTPGVDLFASQPAPSAAASTIDFFAAADPVVQSDNRYSKLDQMNINTVDPFASVPLNTFGNSDPFGAFVSQPVSVPGENASNGGSHDAHDKLSKSTVEAKTPPKKDTFQVRSGIWADSLSRGLIDLNITAPKKVNLADVGIVGGLTDGSDEKEKGPTTFYTSRAMGQGIGHGRSGFPSAATAGDDIFSSLNTQNYQFGGFQK
ncbi:PREDICTED: clathrin interactor EPSIN 1-like isoform X1 [Nicotiana attenuata]|uniref:Clathrin interactor epsin 1 n=1 Tax=Nicotiana attenuata TaxID=49451 RepID=A0A1J6IUR5_NICAT|nr:PREDICTED: clathrin interactor EPSIN 1-like isoform X1 [Nicotiana attenuata]OIT08542.1 clathrin interactor epsin 1 [Nicotiana attenuata]